MDAARRRARSAAAGLADQTTAPELEGRSAFALVTAAAAEQLEIPLDDCIQVVESHEHYAPIGAHVFALST